MTIRTHKLTDNRENSRKNKQGKKNPMSREEAGRLGAEARWGRKGASTKTSRSSSASKKTAPQNRMSREEAGRRGAEARWGKHDNRFQTGRETAHRSERRLNREDTSHRGNEARRGRDYQEEENYLSYPEERNFPRHREERGYLSNRLGYHEAHSRNQQGSNQRGMGAGWGYYGAERNPSDYERAGFETDENEDLESAGWHTRDFGRQDYWKGDRSEGNTIPQKGNRRGEQIDWGREEENEEDYSHFSDQFEDDDEDEDETSDNEARHVFYEDEEEDEHAEDVNYRSKNRQDFGKEREDLFRWRR